MSSDPPPVIAARAVFRGRALGALASYLVEDSAERVVMAVLPGAQYRNSVVPREETWAALARGQWETADFTWHTNRKLWICPTGANYAIGHFWHGATGEFRSWYLNLQTPLRRTQVGFDWWDWALDVVVRPDKTWRWKDEDELAEAVRAGVITPEEARAARAEGERLIERLDEILPTGWESWQPDPSWPPLVLPEGWDRVDEVDEPRWLSAIS